MVWVAVCSHVKTNLVQVHGRLNGKEYVKMLEKEFCSGDLMRSCQLTGFLCKTIPLCILTKLLKNGFKS